MGTYQCTMWSTWEPVWVPNGLKQNVWEQISEEINFENTVLLNLLSYIKDKLAYLERHQIFTLPW